MNIIRDAYIVFIEWDASFVIKREGESVGGGLANVGSIRDILRVYIITVSSTVHSNRHKMLDKSPPATMNEKCFHNACLP